MHPTKFTSKPSRKKPHPQSNYGLSEAAYISTTIAASKWEGSLRSLSDELAKGRTLSSLYIGKKRKISDWRGQQIYGVDIDHADQIPCPIECINQYSEEKLGCKPAIVHHSFSSTPTSPRLRLFYRTSEIVKDSELSLGILERLRKEWNADPVCVDLVRLFYGTHPDGVISVDEDSIIPKTLFLEAKQIREDHQQKIKEQLQKLKNTKVSGYYDSVQLQRTLNFAFSDPVTFKGSGYQTVFNCTLMCYERGWGSDEIIQHFQRLQDNNHSIWRNWKHSLTTIVYNAIMWKSKTSTK